jgi:hypothetical protein
MRRVTNHEEKGTCYRHDRPGPARRFELLSNLPCELETKFSSLPVKRLFAKLDNWLEPVSYWSAIGDKAVLSDLQAKFGQLEYGLKKQVPDSLFFSGSSFAGAPIGGQTLQEKSPRDLTNARPVVSRPRLAGLGMSSQHGKSAVV